MSTPLTDQQRRTIREAWLSYDCAMSDGWRNDFQEDGQAADEWRRENMLNDIREQMPDVPEDEIENEIDRIR